jgi:hypothetical protein
MFSYHSLHPHPEQYYVMILCKKILSNSKNAILLLWLQNRLDMSQGMFSSPISIILASMLGLIINKMDESGFSVLHHQNMTAIIGE